jgi:glycosyltransferase involved in cell wall biosynthesis
MRLLQRTTYGALSSDTHFADRNGSAVATDGMTLACLEDSRVDHIDVLLLDERKVEQEQWRLAKNIPANLQHKISLVVPAQLQQLNVSIALDTVARFTYLLQTLNAAALRAPICSLVHSIPNVRLFDNLLAFALFAQPGDVIVATSTACKSAITTYLTQVHDSLSNIVNPSVFKNIDEYVTTIPLGIDESLLRHVERSHGRDALGLEADALIVLYTGRLSPSYKADLEPLIRAMPDIIAAHSSARLLIAGKDEQQGYEDTLCQIAAECDVLRSIDFRLNFPSYLKRHVYASADVFVSPVDNVQETFGLSLIEAMAAGLPVVATNWSGYRDLVQDERTGFLIDSWLSESDLTSINIAGSASENWDMERLLASRTMVNVSQLISRVVTLLGSSELRRSMGKAAIQVVRDRYTWPAVMDSMTALWMSQEEKAKSRNFTVVPFLDHLKALKEFPDASKDVLELSLYFPERTASVSARRSQERRAQMDLENALASVDYSSLMDPFMLQEVLNESPGLGPVISSLYKRGILRSK